MIRTSRSAPSLIAALILILFGGALGTALAGGGVVVESAAIFDLPVTGGAAVFSSSLTPSKPGSLFLITIQVSGADSTVVPRVTRGLVTKDLALNGSTGAIAAGKLHTFSFGTATTEQTGTALTYNLELGTSCTIDFLSVLEQVND